MVRIHVGQPTTAMTSVQEIEAAIRALTKTEQRNLPQNLQSLFAESDGDAKWARITNDPRPRPSLTVFGDAVASRLRENPASLPEIRDEDFHKIP
jgi:hypothetical protein